MLTAICEALPADDEAMPTIEVAESNGTSASENLRALKLADDRRKLPISVETISSRLIETTAKSNLAGLLEVATSAVAVASEGGSVSDIILRGFGNTPFYRNGLNASLGQLAPRSLHNVDHIEIIKGPSTALFGPGEPGGSINFVTKHPEADTQLEAAAGLGRFGQLAFDVDATGALPRHDDWQYRMIAAREQGDTFRDFVKQDRWLIAPSLAWQPDSNIDIVASVEYLRDDHLLDAGIFKVDGRQTRARGAFLGEPGAGKTRNAGTTARLSATVGLKNQWTFEFQA